MSEVAAVIADLARAGVDPELIGRVAAMAVSQAASVDVQAERRRARDRDRKAKTVPQNSAESADSAEVLSSGSQGSFPPTPPKSPNPPNLSQVPPISPAESEKSARQSRIKPPRGAFARFWAAYPLKVGKGKAEPAYDRAWRRCEGDDPEAEMLDGLSRCAPLWDPDFIPHPTTWLNRDGWLDQLIPDTPDGERSKVIDMADFDAKRAAQTREIEAALAREAAQ